MPLEVDFVDVEGSLLERITKGGCVPQSSISSTQGPCMMGSNRLWASLLHLQPPWMVRNIAIDDALRRLDISVGLDMHSWFHLTHHSREDEGEQVWRHVNIDSWHCMHHVFLPHDMPAPFHEWAGEEGAPFTRAMARHIVKLMKDGVTLHDICQLLGVRFHEVWKLKPLVNHVQARPFPVEPPLPEVTSDTEVAVPDATHPVWQALVEGDLDSDIRVFSLKLLLSYLRSQLATIQGQEEKDRKAEELRSYFHKNQHMLSHELALMRNFR